MIRIDDVYAASPDGAIIVLNKEVSKEQVLSNKCLHKSDVDWHANVEIKCPGGGVGKHGRNARYCHTKEMKTLRLILHVPNSRGNGSARC